MKGLFESLSTRYGEAFANELRRIEGLIVFVNGRDYKTLGGLDALLSESDTVAILPVVTGG
ncbi:MAG: hypothetical protein A2147_06195 [Chloroflexi bacterium RBG_16_57_8]|nr:MAG: hypothetical protein A2147_06195 [Chloroflexi bacterium RBG_16_57_8]